MSNHLLHRFISDFFGFKDFTIDYYDQPYVDTSIYNIYITLEGHQKTYRSIGIERINEWVMKERTKRIDNLIYG